jgi:hypothetical protein
MESCPGAKFREEGLKPSSCETLNEEWVRKKVLAYILWNKEYLLEEIEEEVPFVLDTGQEVFHLKVSLVVRLKGRRVLMIKCGPGSILARERAALAQARLLDEGYPIPLTAVSNGQEAVLLDTVTGETLAMGPDVFPDRNQLLAWMEKFEFRPLPEKRLEMEKRVLAAFEGLGLAGECR